MLEGLVFLLQHSYNRTVASLLFIFLERKSNAHPFNLRDV